MPIHRYYISGADQYGTDYQAIADALEAERFQARPNDPEIPNGVHVEGLHPWAKLVEVLRNMGHDSLVLDFWGDRYELKVTIYNDYIE